MQLDIDALAQQGDLASFCPRCHAPLVVYDDASKRVWLGMQIAVGDEIHDVLLDPRLDGSERVDPETWHK